MSNWLRRRAQDAELPRRPASRYESPLGLTDAQLTAVMQAAGPLDPQKRGVFLERVAARLRYIGSRLNDEELNAAIQVVLRSLIQAPPEA